MNERYAKYLLERTQKDYNLIAEDYSRTRGKVWEELKFLKEYVISREKILDLGCGNGRLYELFEEMSVDYYGVDISEKLIEIAKSRHPKDKFQVADALSLPFPDNFFDKIFSIAVLHHIPSEKLKIQFLKEAKRVLKPNGLLILTIWNLWKVSCLRLHLKHTILKLMGWSKLDFKDIFYPWRNSQGKIIIQRYIHCFTKRELKKVVKKAGFKIKEIGFSGNEKRNIYLIAEKRSP